MKLLEEFIDLSLFDLLDDDRLIVISLEISSVFYFLIYLEPYFDFIFDLSLLLYFIIYNRSYFRLSLFFSSEFSVSIPLGASSFSFIFYFSSLRLFNKFYLLDWKSSDCRLFFFFFRTLTTSLSIFIIVYFKLSAIICPIYSHLVGSKQKFSFYLSLNER